MNRQRRLSAGAAKAEAEWWDDYSQRAALAHESVRWGNLFVRNNGTGGYEIAQVGYLPNGTAIARSVQPDPGPLRVLTPAKEPTP